MGIILIVSLFSVAEIALKVDFVKQNGLEWNAACWGVPGAGEKFIFSSLALVPKNFYKFNKKYNVSSDIHPTNTKLYTHWTVIGKLLGN